MNADVLTFPPDGALGRLVRTRSVARDIVDGIDRVLAANVVALRRPGLPRRPIPVSSWHESSTLVRVSPLRDTTCGQWLGICGARTEFTDIAGHKHAATCTRIVGHTRRHAAGAFGRIVAVWVDPSEARP